MKTIDYIDVMEAFKAFDIYTKRYTAKNKDWLGWKYFHTLDVVKTGCQIIQAEPTLSVLSDDEHAQLERALLFHDIARSKQMKVDGQMIPHFVHGAEGMQMLLEKGERNLAVLASVLVHDQLNMNLLEAEKHVLMNDIVFQKLPVHIQKNVCMINECYRLSSEKERTFVQQACFLVKDADTLSNILNYRQLLNIEKDAKVFDVTPVVWETVLNRQYVSYKDVSTFADRILVYMAWVWYFHYQATIRVLWKHDVLCDMKEYLLSKMKYFCSPEQVTKTDILFRQLIEQIQQFHQKINSSKM